MISSISSGMYKDLLVDLLVTCSSIPLLTHNYCISSLALIARLWCFTITDKSYMIRITWKRTKWIKYKSTCGLLNQNSSSLGFTRSPIIPWECAVSMASWVIICWSFVPMTMLICTETGYQFRSTMYLLMSTFEVYDQHETIKHEILGHRGVHGIKGCRSTTYHNWYKRHPEICVPTCTASRWRLRWGILILEHLQSLTGTWNQVQFIIHLHVDNMTCKVILNWAQLMNQWHRSSKQQFSSNLFSVVKPTGNMT